MKITLITPTYNSASTLRDTIDSIVAQKYNNLEYIIIDGASKDNTKEIVESYRDKLDIKFISEPDRGIYDAMNKGIKMATGDIIGIINSDDFYANESVLHDIATEFRSKPEIEAVYGDLVYVSKDNIRNQNRFWKAGEYSESKLNWGWITPHPTLFVKKSVYDRIGNLFDISLTVAADYELMFRLLKVHKINVSYIPKTFVKMRDGGNSDKNLKNRAKGWEDLKKSWEINSQKLPKFFIAKRVLLKISQFIFRK